MGAACGYPQGHDAEHFVVEEAGFRIPVRTVAKLGWKRDLPDFRDRVVRLPADKKTNLPPKKDLRPLEHFHIYNQGSLGSCTANAIGAAMHFNLVVEQKKVFTPSRLFIYYNERAMEGSTNEDAGAYIRDGIKSVSKLGACSEDTWPYVESRFKEKPKPQAYVEALETRATEYARVPQTLEDLKGVINEGFPICFGFVVYSSFQYPDVMMTGWMHMPGNYDFQMGGHAVLAVGYRDDKEVFIVRNSWGEGWGDKGYFYMPYKYICNNGLAEDFWVIRWVDGKDKLPTVAMHEA